MDTRFKPLAPNFDAMYEIIQSWLNTFTVNTTTRFGFPAITSRSNTADGLSKGEHVSWIERLTAVCHTVPADADGTILCTIKKYDRSAAADVTLATNFNLEGLTAKEASHIPFDSGVTDAQRILDIGDFLFAEVVNNSAAIDTQPVGLHLSALIKLLR
jgi:hypothetical protein